VASGHPQVIPAKAGIQAGQRKLALSFPDRFSRPPKASHLAKAGM
jgi:hypothetical protein